MNALRPFSPFSRVLRAFALVVSAACPVLGFAAPAPLLRLSLETRLPAEADADRVSLAPRSLQAGERIVLAGRLARVTLTATPWDAGRWQLRYRIESMRGAKGAPLQGVFALEENARSEVWLGAAGPLHGLRVELGNVAAQPKAVPFSPPFERL